MPYASKPGRAPLTRVYDKDGIGHRKSMKMTDPDLIAAAQRTIEWLREHRWWIILDAIIADRIDIPTVHEAHTSGQLAALRDRLMAEDAAASAEAADPDLRPLLDEWAKEDGTNAKYVRQVRRFLGTGGKFPASQFRRKRVAEFLRGLAKADGKKAHRETRKRYRVALSRFALYLIEREVIEHNPTRDIDLGRAKAGERRIVYLEPGQVKALVKALPMPNRLLEAIMAATGMEWSAARRLRRRDIDTATRIIFADGRKNDYRTRYVEASEDWAWQIIEAETRRLLPNAPLFPKLREEDALATHHETAKALELPRTTLHNHRNSYAVMWINRSKGDAERLQWLKNQLGHAPQSTLIYTRYGVQIKAARLTAQQEARLGRKAEGA